MTRFRYLFDRICLGACVLYVANRWLLPAEWKGPFLRGYFDDLLLIAAALPVVLGLRRLLGLRRHDRPPSVGEIAAHLLVWSIIAEFFVPHFFHHGTADPWDLLAYAAGALGAGIWWNRDRILPRAAV